MGNCKGFVLKIAYTVLSFKIQVESEIVTVVSQSLVKGTSSISLETKGEVVRAAVITQFFSSFYTYSPQRVLQSVHMQHTLSWNRHIGTGKTLQKEIKDLKEKGRNLKES